MTDTANENVQGNFGPPQGRVIPPSECYAALKLAKEMYYNILSSGDVPEEVLEWVCRVLEESKELQSKLCTDSTGRDENSSAVWDAIMTALLPTFHYGSSQEDAGAALLSLIGVGTKHGWTSPQEEPTQTEKRESAQPPVLTSTANTKRRETVGGVKK